MRALGPLVFASALTVSAIAAAQSTSPVFEVASIRANKTGGSSKRVGDPPTAVGTGGVMTPQGNRFVARNATLRTLIRFAYGSDGDLLTSPLAEEYRVVGGPSWIDTEAFDIVALMPEAATRPMGDPALMLRSLLAERFALKLHGETQELPAYALVRSRPDGRPGPQLRAPSGRCVPPIAPVVRDQIRCGVRNAFQGIIASGVSMTHVAAALSRIIGRTVIDRTTLPGTFDFDLRFTDNLAADARFPSIFTAVQEQLGLKLESIRAPLDIVVIDQAGRPSEN